jgi:polar amino acid transport system permease protein
LLGLLLACGLRTRAVWFNRSVAMFVEFIRRTPLLLQLYFLFYMLPDTGILLSPLSAGVIGLGLHFATYTAEVYRAGIDNVSRGQWDAARACNLSRWHTWTRIILRQAIPPMVPALANFLIAMFKVTPILSALGLIEVMGNAREIANLDYRYLEPMTMVGVLFLIVSLPAVFATRLIERRLSPAV